MEVSIQRRKGVNFWLQYSFSTGHGAPGTGKDEAAEFLHAQYGLKKLSFKEQLFHETFKYFGVDKSWFMEGYDNREIKEKRKEEALGDRTRREALIHVSEDILKPSKGKEVFGDCLASKIIQAEDYAISDCGFSEEIKPVINTVGAENVCLVRLLRDNCTFKNDSRRYINSDLFDEIVIGHKTLISEEDILPEVFDIRIYCIHNNGTLSEFFQAIRKIYLREINVRKPSILRGPV